MRVLITGGAGFIGSTVARELLAQGHEAVVLDDLSTGLASNLPAGVPLHVGDVADVSAVMEAMDGCQGVVHLAAMVSVALSVTEPGPCHRINVVGSQTVFQAAAALGLTRVVYASSAAVYGARPELPKREDQAPHLASPYAASKWQNEIDADYLSRWQGVESVGLRFFNVYGPRQRPDSPYSGVISIAADRLLRQAPFTVFGDGLQSRDFVYSEDVARAVVAALTQPLPKPAEGLASALVFNVGTGRSTTLLDLVAAMEGALGRKAELQFGPDRAGDLKHSLADPGALAEALGVRAEVRVQEGLAQTLAWMQGALSPA